MVDKLLLQLNSINRDLLAFIVRGSFFMVPKNQDPVLSKAYQERTYDRKSKYFK